MTFSYANDGEIPIIEKVSSSNPILADMANAVLNDDLDLFKSFAVPDPELVEEYKEPLFQLSLQSTKFFEPNVFDWLIKAHAPSYWLLKDLIRTVENFELKVNRAWDYHRLKSLSLSINLDYGLWLPTLYKEKIKHIKEEFNIFEIKEFNGFDFIVYRKDNEEVKELQLYDCYGLKDKYRDGEVIQIKFKNKKNPLRKMFQKLRGNPKQLINYDVCLVNENQNAISFLLNSLK